MTKEELIDYVENQRSLGVIPYHTYSTLVYGIDELEQEPLKEIPKDYMYDTETEGFLVYRHKYTGHEIHIEKPVPRYRLEQEPCEDCVSRVEVLEQINCWIGSGEYRYTNATWYLGNRIKNLLSVQPKTGHWINIDDIEYECSECGHREPNERFIFEDINFCAKCGAKMFEQKESEGEK